MHETHHDSTTVKIRFLNVDGDSSHRRNTSDDYGMAHQIQNSGRFTISELNIPRETGNLQQSNDI